MGKQFKIVSMGKAKWILGTRITVNANSIKIDQEKYLLDVLAKFGMTECKPAITPATPGNYNPSITSVNHDKTEYASLIGSLTYLSVISRPDIAFAVSKAGQMASNPSEADWINAKRILRYLKGNPSLGITYSEEGTCTLHGFIDADWAGDLSSRKSTSGYVFILGNAAISWTSKRQQSVALSSTEAEYIAATLATQEAIYL